MIAAEGLKKRYGARTVLDVPKLSVSAGERVALLGPNGCGKSTLLRILAGTLKPDAGAVRSDADAAYLPQTPYAFDCTVLQNVLLALKKGPEREREALRALSRVGMDALASARGKRLSGGETQRMALARVLAAPHGLLLLDEPTSSADLAAEDAVERALDDYLAETGAALLLATHAPFQAARLCTRVLLLYEGRIVEDGPPDEVLHAPKSAEAAAFLKHWRY